MTKLRSKRGLHTRTWVRHPVHELTRTALCITPLSSRAVTWLRAGNGLYGPNRPKTKIHCWRNV